MNTTITRLKVVLAAEKKKAGVLSVLLLLLVVAGVRSTMQAGPSKARAATVSQERRAAAAAAAEKEASGNMTRRARPPVTVERPRPLRRDLFLLSEAHFPLPSQTEPPARMPPKSGSSNVEAAVRKPAGPATEHSAAERVRKEAGSLRLRGTLIGSTPMAVIEVTGKRADKGNVVRPGQVVEGFTLIEVQSTGVVLEKDGVRVELRRVLPEG